MRRWTQQKRNRARAPASSVAAPRLPADLVAQLTPTKFLGYDSLAAGGLEVAALLKDGKPVESIEAGDEAIVILDRTPFYAESGGQVGDTGELASTPERRALRGRRHPQARRSVPRPRRHAVGRHAEARRPRAGRGRWRASRRHDRSTTAPPTCCTPRCATCSATHVQQKGSLVAPDRLRFDFSHFQPVTDGRTGRDRAPGQCRDPRQPRGRSPQHGDAGSAGLRRDGAVRREVRRARARAALRADFSTELCGGTHVGRTGDIGLFKIVSEGGVAAGVRRIEAVTGQGALDHVAEQERRLDEAADLLGGTSGDVADKLRALARPAEEARARARGAEGQGGVRCDQRPCRPGPRREWGQGAWRRGWRASMPRPCAMPWIA